MTEGSLMSTKAKTARALIEATTGANLAGTAVGQRANGEARGEA
jgi:hypothetical protein